ncbi:hypothetical protein D3C85_80000 [compost metagenome]
MSEAVKQELARIDAEIVYIDKVLLAMRQAAEEKRRTLHTQHLEFCADSHQFRERLELKKDGLQSRRRKVEIFKDQPERRAMLRGIAGAPAPVADEPPASHFVIL